MRYSILVGYQKIYSVRISVIHRTVEVWLQILTNTIYNFAVCSIGYFNGESVTRLYIAVFLRGMVLGHFGRNIIEETTSRTELTIYDKKLHRVFQNTVFI